MKYALIGKIVNTHGLKGEIRILSDFKYKDRVFVPGMKIYVGKDKICEEIVTYRHHKIFEMITMKGYNDIDEVLKYKGMYVFVNKNDIELKPGEYLDEDIIGLRVFSDGIERGTVTRIDKHSKNLLLVVKNGDKFYLIPYNFDIILDIDINAKEMRVLNISGLFD